ncbi:MAG: lipocalin [Lutibacter sp.]|uniref:lipocalin family protein n=1 Tax=Lutibacter sp. TaxID=1925666 RepID=UPI0017BB8458|nr:lipocalin family protein [Lutibacter sp.]MBT8317782.1 lipocalin family protein [Lutibacter sp.]NNJ58640.1 lipocalin [Lutibacter sp.]
MKKLKILTPFLILLLITSSCGSTKVVRQSKRVIKGNWTLNQITYDKSDNFKISLFDDAAQNCFEGSTWQFISNNNSGTYTLKSTSCDQQLRYFKFTIIEVDKITGLHDFLLKPTNAKGKSENNDKGYRLKLTQLSDTNMQWQLSLFVEGSPFLINMNFIK